MRTAPLASSILPMSPTMRFSSFSMLAVGSATGGVRFSAMINYLTIAARWLQVNVLEAAKDASGLRAPFCRSRRGGKGTAEAGRFAFAQINRDWRRGKPAGAWRD